MTVSEDRSKEEQDALQQRLIDSILSKDVEGTIRLLNEGARADHDYCRPLKEAIRANNDYAFDILIHRVDIGSLDREPLSIAVANGNVPVFRKLIPYSDFVGTCRLLVTAAGNGHTKLFDAISDRLKTFHGERYLDDDRREAHKDAAREAASKGQAEMLRHILSWLDADSIQELGDAFRGAAVHKTLLSYAVDGGNSECVEIVLGRSHQKTQFMTCLLDACQDGKHEILSLLLNGHRSVGTATLPSAMSLADDEGRRILVEHEIGVLQNDRHMNEKARTAGMKQVLLLSLSNGFTHAVDMMEPFLDIDVFRAERADTNPKEIAALDRHLLERRHAGGNRAARVERPSV